MKYKEIFIAIIGVATGLGIGIYFLINKNTTVLMLTGIIIFIIAAFAIIISKKIIS